MMNNRPTQPLNGRFVLSNSATSATVGIAGTPDYPAHASPGWSYSGLAACLASSQCRLRGLSAKSDRYSECEQKYPACRLEQLATAYQRLPWAQAAQQRPCAAGRRGLWNPDAAGGRPTTFGSSTSTRRRSTAWDGELFAAEMHIVHQLRGASGTDYLAVIGILFRQGPANPFLDGLGWSTPPAAGTSLPVGSDSVDIAAAFGAQLSGGYYHYSGSADHAAPAARP